MLETAVSLLVLTFVFALFYKYVPDAAIGWRDVWLGGLLTAVLFTLGKTAIGVYLGQASVGSAYGAAGSMVVLLVWVYYSALIMFFGAEFTQAWATRHGGVPPPCRVRGRAPDQSEGSHRPPPEVVNAPLGYHGADEPCDAVFTPTPPGEASRALIPREHGSVSGSRQGDGRLACAGTRAFLCHGIPHRIPVCCADPTERPLTAACPGALALTGPA